MLLDYIICKLYIYLHMLISFYRCDVDPIIYPCANFVENINVFLPKEILLLKKIILTTLVSCTRYVDHLDTLYNISIKKKKVNIMTS